MSEKKNISLDAENEDVRKLQHFMPYILTDFSHTIQDVHPEVLPLIELRNNIFFPRTLTPITVGRERTLRLIEDLPTNDSYIIVVGQKDPDEKFPNPDDLFEVGTLGKIVHKYRENGTFFVLIEGLLRVKITEFRNPDPYYTVMYEEIPEKDLSSTNPKLEAYVALLKDSVFKYSEELRLHQQEVENFFYKMQNWGAEAIVNFLSMFLNLPTTKKYDLITCPTLLERAQMLLEFVELENETEKWKKDIHNKTRKNLEEQQRNFFLQQERRTIDEELGNDEEHDADRLLAEGAKKKWSAEVAAVFEREVARLRRSLSMVADYSMQLNYLQFFLALPWNEYSKDNNDLKRAQKILDEDHFGLEEVKERILEYLAVLRLTKNMKSPILCLYGPPGVGKTSLGKSIARALGRKYVRISLGGMSDESEIRGHRRTYVGALPGQILTGMRRAGTDNPVMVLDEVDKLTASNAGDPAAALLEVLDPEQNSTFHDNYLDLGYDLSHVLFIATANDISTIAPALRDRMEMIEVSGYLMEDKIAIAQQFLIPKVVKEHGLKKSQFALSDAVLEKIISEYTAESGVRKLTQQIAKLVRQQAKYIGMKEQFNNTLTAEDILKRLGKPRVYREKTANLHQIGVAVGMAWTPVGGEILYVESSLMPGKGNLTMTGSLGDVIKESVTIAYQIVKQKSKKLGLKPEQFDSQDMHVHFPEGATPKDGPSAGVTLVTAITSSFLQIAPKAGIAMTGEVTLRGKILPVGGIKEKILAAKREGLTHILLPKDNRRDVEDIKANYLEGLTFTYLDNVDELLANTFEL